MLVFNNFEKNIISKYSYNIKDTGSTEIQIILISFKIKKLEIHIKKNKKDFSNKRGLLILYNKRIKLLKYLKKKKVKIYFKILKDLELENIDVVEW